MNPLKGWALAGAIVMFSMLMACGGGKEAEARKIMADHAQIMETYAGSLEKAESAADCASAIDTFTDQMEKMMPRFKDFEKKHPDFFQAGGESPPGLEKEHQRMVHGTDKLQAASMNMIKYMMDPQVQSAMQRMAAVMQQAGN
ncbi:MAG: hypothetical protein JJV98_05220 [Desulfosarcina sp.]|nr:hypothetical protein [Desulfobacterales bacterium]